MRDLPSPQAGQPPAVPAQRRPPPGQPAAAIATPLNLRVRQAVTERLGYLNDATRQINTSLDPAATVRSLAKVLVPALADAALVHLREPVLGGGPRRDRGGPVELRLHRAEGTRLGNGRRVVTAQPGGALDRALREAAPAGPVVLGTAEGERLRPLFAELYGARALAGLARGTALLALPLRGREKRGKEADGRQRRADSVLGLLVLVRRPGKPDDDYHRLHAHTRHSDQSKEPARFDPADTQTAAHLATLAGLAVDTAQRYTRESEIANKLQRSMLPDDLPQPHGVRLAHRYLPGEADSQVGGDWYDAIPLPGNRVALIVGDVMGHSLTSAAVMGQLRTSAQTLAALDLPPHEVLYHLDEQAQRLGREQHLATCVFAVYDPIANRIVVANAGHMPPALIHPDGRAELLEELPAGAPIGVGGVDFASQELDAPPGSALLLFTDGLVETRRRPLASGLERLRERLSGVHQHSPEQLCHEALRILPPGDRGDDIALLAAAFDGIPADDVAYWYLQPRNETPGRARRLVGHALRRWGLDELVENTELMVSELVTNAVQHAKKPVTLRLVRTSVLRCEIGDDSPQLPRRRRAGLDEERGRGLELVAKCADDWGSTRLGGGKMVWFEQKLPPRAFGGRGARRAGDA
ncbi:serine/threonine-protein phosphatase [Kitasatospora sp. GAS204B]|uniref:ATP-binding SpoIIE family protein phosphatase n=1 Tax=unclassified Kitasatospora TaxID=2633591 RepID=UPI00247442F7|nr:serine/threonine-protein phosphatase [Kitasatospora sp. GAS204B]MDH6116590.1 anti-sigma regulatory factor (Ser/Thr protein kinase) [Kitasatospora sp. GAS204B]